MILIILSVAVSYLLWQNHIYTTEKIKQKVRAEWTKEIIAKIKCQGNRNCEMTEPGLDVNRPDSDTSEIQENAAILIAIGSNDEIYMDGRRIDVRQVKANVLKLLADNPQGNVVIYADETASADAITQVMDGARDAGVYDISLTAEPN